MAEIDELRERLALAERVCAAYAGVAADFHAGTRSKATLQAWMEWYAKYGKRVPHLTDVEYEELAARRDQMREATLATIRGETGSADE